MSERATNVEKTDKRLEIIDFDGETGHFCQFFQTSLEKCRGLLTKTTIWKNGGKNWKNTKFASPEFPDPQHCSEWGIQPLHLFPQKLTLTSRNAR